MSEIVDALRKLLRSILAGEQEAFALEQLEPATVKCAESLVRTLVGDKVDVDPGTSCIFVDALDRVGAC